MRVGVVMLVSGALAGLHPAAAQSKDTEPTLQQLEARVAEANHSLATLP